MARAACPSTSLPQCRRTGSVTKAAPLGLEGAALAGGQPSLSRDRSTYASSALCCRPAPSARSSQSSNVLGTAGRRPTGPGFGEDQGRESAGGETCSLVAAVLLQPRGGSQRMQRTAPASRPERAHAAPSGRLVSRRRRELPPLGLVQVRLVDAGHPVCIQTRVGRSLSSP